MTIARNFELPATRGLIAFPGLPILPPDMERHPVPGRGSRAVPVEAGDEITLVDREGGQVCELVFFTPDGANDPARLGATSDGRPQGLMEILSENEPSARKVRCALEAAGFDLAGAGCVRLFGAASRPGTSETFRAQCEGLLIVAAPGSPMTPDTQSTATEIVLYVRRATPRRGKARRDPPAPLADPLCDMNIDPGRARAYEVRRGQFIQIVDVQGRECSDLA